MNTDEELLEAKAIAMDLMIDALKASTPAGAVIASGFAVGGLLGSFRKFYVESESDWKGLDLMLGSISEAISAGAKAQGLKIVVSFCRRET